MFKRIPNFVIMLSLALGLVLIPASAGAQPASPATEDVSPEGSLTEAHGTDVLPADLQDAFFAASSRPFASSRAGYSSEHDGLRYALTSTGLQAQTSGLNWSVSLRGIGRGNSLQDVPLAEPVQTDTQVEYRREALTEWYRDLAVGVEQGFAIHESLPGNGQLVLHLDLKTNLPGVLDADERGLSFAGAEQTLRYDGLKAYDANGIELQAKFIYNSSRIVIQVDDRQAAYPITIDPLVYLEQKVIAFDGAAGDRFGYSVALSGDTALVGARGDDGQKGSAYVFVKSGGAWAFAAKLTASDGAEGDQFGASVALSGDTALVGAYWDDGYMGSAYVFVKPGGGWATGTETAKLTASDGAEFDYFGISVALSGDTALVGANGDNIAISDEGSAYVFVKPGGGWASGTQTAKLTASDGAASDYFGSSVALSGDTALVGAFGDDSYQGSAYVFVKPVGGWATTSAYAAKLTALDGLGGDFFGASVALSGDTALVGAWADNIAVSDEGSAYVFVKPVGGWATGTETAKLTASDGAAGDYFGWSVALSGDTALAGAISDDSAKGSAYVFVKPGGGWVTGTETARLTASDGAAGDSFGWSVALSGDTALVGAFGDDSNKGSAYFYYASDDLGVSAAFSVAAASAGDTVYLTTTATCISPNSSAFDTALSAPLPAGLTYVSSAATQGGYDSGTGTWNIESLAGSASASLTIEAVVTSFPTNPLTFTASLVGSDINPANDSASDTLSPVLSSATFTSQAANDGWVLESAETSGMGGSNDSIATTLRVGDDVADKQYRGILSFDTSGLPDTVVITGVTLKVKKYSIVATDPFTTHGTLMAAIRQPYFGSAVTLANSDFQAALSKQVGFNSTPVSNWYSTNYNSAIWPYINLTGTTQFRLKFTLDDNDDLGADYVRFYSGNASMIYRPQLIVEYYVP